MGLRKNLGKTMVIVCTPGFIWGNWGELAYKRRVTGEVASFGEKKKMRVS